MPVPFGLPIEFALFAATLLCVAVFHRYTLHVALTGFAAIVAYKLVFTGFNTGWGLPGLASHFQHHWVLLANLLAVLIGFALLSSHFERSRIPDTLPRFLPRRWQGAFLLLAIVFVLSGLLDNIAAAAIGATVAGVVFRRRVHIGYLAAIVAAANAGGAGSVVGDTTTTMMWISGVEPLGLLVAYLPAAVALVVFGIPAAMQQHRFQPIGERAAIAHRVDWVRTAIVLCIMSVVIATNVLVNLRMREVADSFPILGTAVLVAIAVSSIWRQPDWTLLPQAFKGALFLLALVACASMMPVTTLPAAGWPTALALGFLSAMFDNIPLTALALRQGGYDWAMLAFSVGFGGSMLWFGSSAGVAVANLFPQAKSVAAWVRYGWHIPLSYVAGFFAMLVLLGWNPA